jgi:Fic family protein
MQRKPQNLYTWQRRAKPRPFPLHKAIDVLRPSYDLPDLPPQSVVETPAILKALTRAHRYLAELKGRAATIPNQGILIDTLSLQEAKASSEIENIVTTQDELFQTNAFPENPGSPAAKEVARYRDALHHGFNEQRRLDGLLTNNMIIAMFRILKGTDGGFRETPGTALKNESTGALVYVPPQDANAVRDLMTALERFIHVEDAESDLDPLTRMAIIHHQFESIHPFPDGNGRLGRIINVLFLTRCGLLDIPILYLSRFITQNKADYYKLLQDVRDTREWEPWLLYILRGVEETAIETLRLVEGIRTLMADAKKRLREEHPKLYSQDLLNNLFRHPYTRIEFVQQELNVSRPTATKYLDELAESNLLVKHRAGRNNYYINQPLVALFMERK